jgi:hypothetical protein
MAKKRTSSSTHTGATVKELSKAKIDEPLQFHVIFFNDDFGGVIMSAVMIVWGLFVYMILVHYPLFLYAVDDGKPVWHYAIGLVGFSFRHFGALLRLLFSMIGWIALCFFVVPVIYVAPYLITACANSARWLAIIEGMNVQLLPAAVHNGNDSL